MDPSKVDSVLNWKVPTNRELLSGFLGPVGYLADNIERVRVPMGVLHTLTGATVPWNWNRWRDHHRVPLDYSPDAATINVVTDASSTGLAGVVSQGEDWKNSKVAAFFSAKLNPAQQNYPVHEQEMFAGVETMRRHRDI